MNIGVFFGSRSPEHDVSIITGELIISELKKLGHTVVPVYLDKNGRWFVSEELGALKFFTGGPARAGGGTEKMENYGKVYLDIEASKRELVFKKKGFGGKEYVVDLAFPAFHGRNGEDGTIQGLFEIFNVPYVGCDVASSAITMDKVITKLLCERFGIPTADFIYFESGEWDTQKSQLLDNAERKLSWPMFVKPARLGSSIGITKAKNSKELEFAIEVALKYDDKVLVEKAVENLADITCCVIGSESPKVSLLQEAVFGSDLFSYEDKYLEDGGAQLGNAKQKLVIPADIGAQLTEEIRRSSAEIFKRFGCSGIARVDFLLDRKSGKYYVSEINTLPGTLYHHLWKASGVEIGALIKELIKTAEERYKKKERLINSFESDLLKFAGSIKLKMKDTE
ncbi:MAG: D-alanine--D-alanine ligase family protein [Candidatus Liptonbacteria bacterium]|nr:D-alanine--D-alanine ligase family protein [Candidatus Liptonbacteria bacterium]